MIDQDHFFTEILQKLQSLQKYSITSEVFQEFDSEHNIRFNENLQYTMMKRRFKLLDELSKIALTLIEICCKQETEKIKS